MSTKGLDITIALTLLFTVVGAMMVAKFAQECKLTVALGIAVGTYMLASGVSGIYLLLRGKPPWE